MLRIERFLYTNERKLNQVSPQNPTIRTQEAKVPSQAALPQK